ncbi:peroxisomal N(1)-acetyl-spermine/spermidine oxidase-like isoform X2 [Rhodnius prolixus]
MADSIIEMGPQWISGASIANNVFTLAAQEGLLKPPLRRVVEDQGMYFTSDGRAIDIRLAQKAKLSFDALEAKAANLLFSEEPLPKKSMFQYFDDLIKKELLKFPETERYDAARLFYGFENSLKTKIGEDLTEVSSTAFGSLHELPGGDVVIPLGMGGLLAPLIRDLPNCALIYCKPVHSIRWGTAGPGNPRAVVRCCDGDDFPADYVIVTVPLGVLKKLSSTLFCPALPASKTIAIEKLGFGYVNKIFMEHKNPFWTGKTGGYRLAWSPQELREEDIWVHGVTSFERVPGSHKVIVATVSGRQAKMMENKSNAEVVKDLTNVLRQFVADSSIPQAASIMRSDWATNPNFYGSFTYISKDSSVGHIHDLKEPLPGNCNDIPPIILFAGEHTSPKYFATMHGARQSGIREADRIIALTRKLNGPPNKGPVCVPCGP